MARPIDRSTIDRLVVEHLPVALRFAMRLSGRADVAEDVVQEAFCRVLRQWTTYRADASFRTWMLQIVLNVDRDRRRRRRDALPVPTDELVAIGPSPGDEASLAELHAGIRAAIERLPERQREVAVLCLGEGLPAGEAAQILGVTEANVYTCLHLARRRIAAALGMNYSRPKQVTRTEPRP